MRYTICIERPAKELSPNARGHWTKAFKARKLARRDAQRLALSQWGTDAPRWKQAMVTHRWVMPTLAHHPDPDNAAASLKSWLDGFSDWGVVENDKGLIPMWGGLIVTKTYIDSTGQSWPRGCVVLTFEELKA